MLFGSKPIGSTIVACLILWIAHYGFAFCEVCHCIIALQRYTTRVHIIQEFLFAIGCYLLTAICRYFGPILICQCQVALYIFIPATYRSLIVLNNQPSIHNRERVYINRCHTS